MSHPDGYGGEMPEFPYPRRGGERPLPGVALDRLLAGELSDEEAEAAPEIGALAELLAAAAAPATARELAGETAAIAVFARARDTGGRPHTAARRRSMLATFLSTKLAAAAAAGAIGFGGVAAAAYAGALPEPIQDFAHQTVGAPSADSDTAGQGDAHKNGSADSHANAGSSGQAVGPDATGPAKYGLCTAFAQEKAENGKVDTKSVAFKALAEAAGGANKIDAYCADATPPSDSATSESSSADHPTGEPTTATDEQPSGTPSTPDHPSGKPTDLTTGS